VVVVAFAFRDDGRREIVKHITTCAIIGGAQSYASWVL
jgi:hypothetical protein